MKSSRSEFMEVGKSPETRMSDPAARWMVVATFALVVSISCLTGCTPFRGLRENLQYNDGMNDFVMGWRNSAWARQAWNERKSMYVNEPQFVTFGQGFRDGYADVAGGANGCVPGLPPRRYWTWKYQTGEGQAKVAAWFAGYPYGAQAAQEDGAGHFQQIQVSHLIEAQYSPEFRNGICPGCDPTLIPGGPVIDVIPETGEPTPLLVPAPALPAPIINPTSQVAPPANAWPSEAITRIPRTVPAYSPNAFGAVVPASAQFPMRGPVFNEVMRPK